MKFGFIIPHNFGLDDPDDVLNIGKRAEELGFDSVWVNHHILNVGYIFDRLGTSKFSFSTDIWSCPDRRSIEYTAIVSGSS